MVPHAERIVGNVFAGALRRDPDAEALVTRGGRWTYRELDRAADRAAGAFQDLGIRAGDRVAASLPNDADVVVAFHGAMRVGAIWVGVNRPLAPPEKRFILEDAGVSVLLADDDVVAQVADGAPWMTLAVDAWRERVAGAPETPRPGGVIDPFAPAAIAYTSGTTGFPKGAIHSQYNLMLAAEATVSARGYGPGLRKGDCLPLTILNMLVLTTLVVAHAGGCCVIMDRIDAGGVAEWIERERVTTWNGPPALLHSLVTNEAVRPAQMATLDEVWTGGADCPEALREGFRSKFGLPVIATYGLTEAPTLVSIDGRDGSHRVGASGQPLPHLEVRVVGTDGEPVAPGDTGEVTVGAAGSGPWAGQYRPMLGYWQRPDATASTVIDGVLHTGDIGSIDADGYLSIRDRKSLVIIRGGANVYPAEVERVMQEVDGVAASAVVGIADERLGERVVAIVERTPGREIDVSALREHCAANLARYKVPERFVVVDALPRNPMGKISRRDLGPLAAEPS
ncbi:MAG: long-chain fatty acid--CoA ligase [Acidimicrobiales bacterium]